MQVTQVVMQLSHPSDDEMNKMHYWLYVDPSFLFDAGARLRYGFTQIGLWSGLWWDRKDVHPDANSSHERHIRFAFTLRTYDYPRSLTDLLRSAGWTVQAAYRQIRVADPTTAFEDMSFSGQWTRDEDPGQWTRHVRRRTQHGLPPRR